MKKVIKEIAAGFEDAIAYMQGDKSRVVVTEYIKSETHIASSREKKRCKSSKKFQSKD